MNLILKRMCVFYDSETIHFVDVCVFTVVE